MVCILAVLSAVGGGVRTLKHYVDSSIVATDNNYVKSRVYQIT